MNDTQQTKPVRCKCGRYVDVKYNRYYERYFVVCECGIFSRVLSKTAQGAVNNWNTEMADK